MRWGKMLSWALVCAATAVLGWLLIVAWKNTHPAPEADNPAALAYLRTHPAWLFPADACPADVMPPVEQKLSYDREGCAADLGRCINQCHNKDGNACYGLALTLQQRKSDPNADQQAEAVFLQACKNGISSGCTNRAAGMQHAEGDRHLVCANRTYRATCDRHDPWGCTMLGAAIYFGEGLKRDLPAAKRELKKGCNRGADTPSCETAEDLLHRIEEEEASAAAQ